MNRTKIPYADFTWNPVTGCSGPNGTPCSYCFARKIADRFKHSQPKKIEHEHPNGWVEEVTIEPRHYPSVGGTAVEANEGDTFPFGFFPTVYPHRLDEPLRRKKPATIFCCDMGDLFGPEIPEDFIRKVFVTFRFCPHHTFFILTKRAEAMQKFILAWYSLGFAATKSIDVVLPNVWLGVTVTNQADADERIPILLDTPAAYRWVSYEPCLGGWLPWYTEGADRLNWVVAGPLTNATAPGFNGKKYHYGNTSAVWIATVADWSQRTGVPFFDKRTNYLAREFPW